VKPPRTIFICTLLVTISASLLLAQTPPPPRIQQLSLVPGDVIATGNQWISLPDIRSEDGALTSFNVISMHHRGLLQVNGQGGAPVIQPYFQVDSKPLPLRDLHWQLAEYWVPTGRTTVNGLEVAITWCAPPGSRAAFLRLQLKNTRPQAVATTLGTKSSWGSLSRVTYTPVVLRGTLNVADSAWVPDSKVFSFATTDTDFAWALTYSGSTATVDVPPTAISPSLETARTVTLAPGESTEALFVLSAGLEEFSAPHNGKSLREMLTRNGADAVLADAAAWCRKRTRTTGQPDLDLLMNRNLLFTDMYAWGRTIDTEQLVGVTSRSPRYYVSAAYWDRDAMLWSFPGLLDSDPALAKEALEYALTIQLRNTGTHSRFIDGVVLEDGFQLDEAVAPLRALSAYVQQTGDENFLRQHHDALDFLIARVLERRDPATGLFISLQDSQDEFQKLPFLTYDNALTWKALTEASALYTRLGEKSAADALAKEAATLHQAILDHMIAAGAPGATGTIFVEATDGKQNVFADVPPGSLLRLPELGFVQEEDPVFRRTYDWLHSPNYKYSYSDKAFGLPGSYRVAFTTSWTVADELGLARGHDKALKVLRTSNWDGGIISEGVDPATGVMDQAGRAFATAAGYVAHAICKAQCVTQEK
jgi:hypothetical protein